MGSKNTVDPYHVGSTILFIIARNFIIEKFCHFDITIQFLFSIFLSLEKYRTDSHRFHQRREPQRANSWYISSLFRKESISLNKKKKIFEILLQLHLEVLFDSLPRKLEGDQDGFIKWEMSPVSLENKYLPLSLDLILYFIIETIMGGG